MKRIWIARGGELWQDVLEVFLTKPYYDEKLRLHFTKPGNRGITIGPGSVLRILGVNGPSSWEGLCSSLITDSHYKELKDY